MMKMEMLPVSIVEGRVLAGIPPQNPSEVVSSRGFVCGLMGLPSAGKTTLIETLEEDHLPVAVFNMDNGAGVIHDKPGKIQVYTPGNWPILDKMIDQIELDPKPFKTLWIDRANDVQAESVEFYKIHDVPTANARGRQTAYGDSNWDVVQFHRRLMKIAEKHDINVFFTYLASRPVIVEGSGSQLTTRHIVMSPTVSLQVTGLLNFVVYIEQAQGLKPYPPVMTLYGDQSIETRLRIPLLNPIRRWPAKVPNPSLGKLIRAYKGEIFDGNYSQDVD